VKSDTDSLNTTSKNSKRGSFAEEEFKPRSKKICGIRKLSAA